MPRVDVKGIEKGERKRFDHKLAGACDIYEVCTGASTESRVGPSLPVRSLAVRIPHNAIQSVTIPVYIAAILSCSTGSKTHVPLNAKNSSKPSSLVLPPFRSQSLFPHLLPLFPTLLQCKHEPIPAETARPSNSSNLFPMSHLVHLYCLIHGNR